MGEHAAPTVTATDNAADTIAEVASVDIRVDEKRITDVDKSGVLPQGGFDEEQALEYQRSLDPFPVWAVDKATVCIAGCAPASRMMVNDLPPEVAVWSITDAYKFITRRIDGWFDMHREQLKKREKWLSGFVELDGRCLYMPEPYVEGSVAYPLGDVCEILGLPKWEPETEGHDLESGNMAPLATRPYLTSSIAYMIALAISRGFEEIILTGIQLEKRVEYLYQRSCVEYWIGRAEGAGIKVTLPDNCPMLKADFLYGYETPNALDYDTINQYLHASRRQVDEHFGLLQQKDSVVKTLELLQTIEPDRPLELRLTSLLLRMREERQQTAQDLDNYVGARDGLDQLMERMRH